jgi:hypothetical protein
MRSDLQKETSRHNGTKSRGPRTEAGKARSSRNRYNHGVYTKTIVIEGEEGRCFHALLVSLRAQLQPRTFIEEELVEDLAIYRWKQKRLLSMETASLSHKIRGQAAQSVAESPAIRAVQAFGDLSHDSRALELMNRYELRFARQFNRTLRQLLDLQAGEKSKNAGSNPGS